MWPFVRGRLTFESLVWKIDHREVPAPTTAELDSLDGARGDGAYLKHGRAKNYVFGSFFAPTPSFFPFHSHSPRNAARSLRALERMAALRPSARRTTPLFGPTPGEEFTHHQVEESFLLMLEHGARVSPAPAALRESCG